MKSTKLTLLVALFSLFLFNSCDGDDEPIDPALLIPSPALCDPPAFLRVSSFINNNTVRIEWDKTSGNEWEIEYGVSGFARGNGTTVDFTATSSLINGLTSTIDYDFYIRTKCGDEDYSVWVGPVSPGDELATCSSPSNVTAVRFPTDATKVTVTWLPAGDENSWQVQYGNVGFTIGSGTILASSIQSKVVSNLLANVSYDFYVRSNCDANQNSAWVGPIVVNAVGSSACTAPTNLTAVRSASDSSQATLSWTAGGSESTWEIQYGNVGFTAGSGTSVGSTDETKVITNLQTTSYDFYVRAICSGTENSNWLGPITMAAFSGGVDTSPAMMTANIAGVQYNQMQPYGYPFTNDVSVISTEIGINPYFLWIQGDTSIDLAITKEINLYIPESLWNLGTYNLSEQLDLSSSICQVHMISEVGAGPITSIFVTNGTITITEFNIVTKRIKGTFSFTYNKTVDDVPQGTFQVTNGTFNYGLDDPYFD